MEQQKRISTTLSILLIALLIVIVGGAIVYKYCSVPEEEPSAGEPGETQDETADWKTYRNEEYGFEIKYPEEGKINFETKEEEYFRVYFSLPNVSEGQEDNLRKSLEIIIKNSSFPILEDYWCGELDVEEKGTVRIGNIEFHKTIGERPGMNSWSQLTCYSTMKEDKLFQLVGKIWWMKYTVTQGVDFDPEEECKIFNQILSTFRFLE